MLFQNTRSYQALALTPINQVTTTNSPKVTSVVTIVVFMFEWRCATWWQRLNPNSQPKTTRNTLPVHLLQNNSGKFVVFAFGRCSRHFIVFSRRKTSCARRGNLPPPISSLQNQLKLKQLPDLHTCILQDSFPGKFNSSWVIRNNFTLHLS